MTIRRKDHVTVQTVAESGLNVSDKQFHGRTCGRRVNHEAAGGAAQQIYVGEPKHDMGPPKI